MRQAVVFLLLLIAAFCVFGFIASWEPGPRAIYFRVGYPLVGFASAAAAAALLLARRNNA